MKLQKLVYLAYGWHFAYLDKQLFSENIYALKHGPVVMDLYHRYKQYRKNPIAADVSDIPVFDEGNEWLMQQIWDNYARCSDFRLSAITHRPDSPWSQTYSPQVRFAVIKPELISAYFKKLREKYENAQI